MQSSVQTTYRTHHCGAIRLESIYQTIQLAGWVRNLRRMGGLVFIDLTDRYGTTQIVIEEPLSKATYIDNIGREDVLEVKGIVRERSNKNPQLATGEVEVQVVTLRVLSKSLPPPFTLRTDTDGGEELRMKYRYLDLRRPPLQRNLHLRHQLNQAIRHYLDEQDFLDIETPFLIRSTPEGARDFVIPSRREAGAFYALPQSPQLFKQLLMLSGYDRYYQIVRCFRDEDLRADRQPEFTQLDCEMSFVSREDVLTTFEGLMAYLWKTLKDIDITLPFPRLTWEEAMHYYGTDKPDTRFDMRFQYFEDILKHCSFPPFQGMTTIIGIKAPHLYSRKHLEELTNFLITQGWQGKIFFAHYEKEGGTIRSSFAKYLSEEEVRQLLDRAEVTTNEMLLIIAGKDKRTTQKTMHSLRMELARKHSLRDASVYHFLWVVDFPLLEWDEKEQRFFAAHHPFTAPKESDIAALTDPDKWHHVQANAYDLVVNGVEVGGGSIRISERNIQEQVFHILGLSKDAMQAQFGFLLDAFQYGVPPHGGIAIGVDRLCALLGGSDTIRDFIAFPKNNQGKDTMLDAPTLLDETQLAAFHLCLQNNNKDNVT